ncbi:histidine kinase N-terminal 7TM domain-containing protein [Bacillus sp. JCM 19034]|uniref:histidine kinase N-terminal 7TM domain-containing protein n=1 Tax=Bacillus sp. JCM 19034 TaxID=1481928 RepID=UPI0007822DBF|nr:histidine kinase N-terminal 7TM domain-containing protein [Bacillus sp. JCM 19034]
MDYPYFLFSLLLVTTGCIMYISYLAWKKRGNSAILCFFYGMCACCFYSFGYAFELISTTLEQIQFWLKIQYIGISFGTLIWFYTIVLFTNHRWFLKNRVRLLMMVIPVMTLISHYTNDWHHLYYKTITLNVIDDFTFVSTTLGPLYIIHAIFNYLLFFMTLAMLIRMYRKVNTQKKKQVMLMIIGSFGPYGMSLIYVSGVLNVPIDITPFGFLFLGACFILGIYRYNMLELVPHALQKVFESMKDAVIVLDLEYRISSYNESAKKIVNSLNSKKMIGQAAADVFSPYPELINLIKDGAKSERKSQNN